MTNPSLAFHRVDILHSNSENAANPNNYEDDNADITGCKPPVKIRCLTFPLTPRGSCSHNPISNGFMPEERDYMMEERGYMVEECSYKIQ